MSHGNRSLGRVVTTTLVTVLLAVAALAGVALVVIAVQNRADQNLVDSPPLLVLGEITDEPLVDEVVGKISIGASRDVVVGAQGVVTRDGAAPGVPLTEEGAILATINELPIIMLLGDIPSFRALSKGAEGADVLQLQTAMERFGYTIWDDEGTYGDSTALAVYHYFRDQEMTPVTATGTPTVAGDWGSTGVPANRIIFVPMLPASPVTQCGRTGDLISGELCILSVGAANITFEVPQVDSARIQAGVAVEMKIGEETSMGTIGDALPVPASGTEEDKSSSSHSTARFTAAFEGKTSLIAGQEGTGRVIFSQSATGYLRVEGAAIRDREGAQPWLLLKDGAELPIELDICVGGYCAIQADRLLPGSFVVVAGIPESSE